MIDLKNRSEIHESELFGGMVLLERKLLAGADIGR